MTNLHILFKKINIYFKSMYLYTYFMIKIQIIFPILLLYKFSLVLHIYIYIYIGCIQYFQLFFSLDIHFRCLSIYFPRHNVSWVRGCIYVYIYIYISIFSFTFFFDQKINHTLCFMLCQQSSVLNLCLTLYMCVCIHVYVINTYSITSHETYLTRYNLSDIKVNQDTIHKVTQRTINVTTTGRDFGSNSTSY